MSSASTCTDVATDHSPFLTSIQEGCLATIDDPAQRLHFSNIVGFITNLMSAIQANEPEIKIRDVVADYCRKHIGIAQSLTGAAENVNETPTTPCAEYDVLKTPAAATPGLKRWLATLSSSRTPFQQHQQAPHFQIGSFMYTPSTLCRVGKSADAAGDFAAGMPTDCNECTSVLVPGNWYRHNEVGFGICRKCYYTAFSQEQFTWADITKATNAAAPQGGAPASPNVPPPPPPPPPPALRAAVRSANGGSGDAGGAREFTPLKPRRRAGITRGAASKGIRRATTATPRGAAASGARLTLLSQTAGGDSPRARGALRSQADAMALRSQSPQPPPWTPPRSTLVAMMESCFNSPLVGSTPSISADSPALFFAAPPAPPPGLHFDL